MRPVIDNGFHKGVRHCDCEHPLLNSNFTWPFPLTLEDHRIGEIKTARKYGFARRHSVMPLTNRLYILRMIVSSSSACNGAMRGDSTDDDSYFRGTLRLPNPCLWGDLFCRCHFVIITLDHSYFSVIN
jgi:hypothetical protein